LRLLRQGRSHKHAGLRVVRGYELLPLESLAVSFAACFLPLRPHRDHTAVLFAAEYVDLRAVGETSGSAEGRTLRVSESTLPPP
jgi:hypothetical protein